MNRRSFLEAAGTAAAGLLLPASARAGAAMPAPQVDPAEVLDPSTLTPFVDPLPLPPVARPLGMRPNPMQSSPMRPGRSVPYYRMAMRQMRVRLHRSLPPTRIWGFNQSSPGPILETRSGEPFLVEWANELPLQHFLPIDHRIHGAEKNKPDVRSVIHLHGGKTPPQYDGYPEEWYVPGKSATYYYPNQQDAALLFYHDHSMGTNRLNIYAGLQGLAVIRDAEEDALNLPRGRYEVPLLLCDRLLRKDGQLYYPTSGIPGAPWVPEVFGNAVLVNGRLLPYLEVEPRRYRLRILNGSNGRFYRLSLGQQHTMYVIGSDQGLLSAPVELESLQLAPAERADVVVDFSGHAGKQLVLASDSLPILQFRVASGKVKDASSLPATLRPVQRIPASQAVRTRRLTLDEHLNHADQSMNMLLNNTPWSYPVTEKPTLNTTEIWELLNLTKDTHPIHLHLVRFQLLDRRPFDISEYFDSGEVKFLGEATPPEPAEAGWKDTVRADTGMLTRILVPFTGYTGRYVWHCHILEHEDNEMMRPYEVVPAAQS